MIKYVFLILSFLISVQIQAEEVPSNVRVRLSLRLSQYQLSGLGVSYQGQKANYLPVAIPREQSVKIARVLIQGQWVWQIESSARTEIRSEENIAIRGSSLQAEGKSLPPEILLQGKKSKFDVIGILPLENYLVGVLASEMPLRWPLESLRAQAIAARSYTLALMKERKKRSFHVESSIQDQVFRHVVQGVDQDPLIAKAFEAVSSTRGMVLISPKSNEVLKAFYHSDCGGKTSSTKSVWGFGKAEAGVVDESCPARPESQWTFRISQGLLKQKIAKMLNETKDKFLARGLASLELSRKDEGSRVDHLKINFENGITKQILADQFRAVVGYSNLKSTQFEMSESDGEYTFRGRGFGHGVGLCQWGSRSLATKGQSFSQILSHYYPSSQIKSKF